MNPQTRYLAAGAFLLLGSMLLVVLILWLGQRGERTPTSRYVVEIPSGIAGLSNGSTVRYLGVDVGNVQNIRLQTTPQPYVEVLFDIHEHIPVDDSTYATLIDQGVTGISNVNLGSDPGQSIPPERSADGVVIVPFRASGLAAILADGDDISAGLKQLVAQLNELTRTENRDRIGSILSDLSQLSQGLAEYKNEIPMLLEDLRDAMASIRETADNLGRVVTHDLPPVTSDLKTVSMRLVAISTRVDDWLANNEVAIQGLLRDGAGNIPALVDDLRDTSSELLRLAASLREDPSQFVYRPRHDAVEVDP